MMMLKQTWLVVLIILVKQTICQDDTDELEDWEQGIVDEGSEVNDDKLEVLDDKSKGETGDHINFDDDKIIKGMILKGVIEYEDGENGKTYHNIAPELEMKTVHKPKDCVGPANDNDEVSVEYYRVLANRHTLDSDKTEGERVEAVIGVERTVHVWLVGMCLGERRRLVVPKKVKEKYKNIFPYMGKYPVMEFEVELTRINMMHWETFDSGLTLAMMEPVQQEYCARTVVDGDTLAVEYKGSLEDGTVFDSSAARKAPFGPFVQGRGEIIAGYEEALDGRCLGERFRMTVPPHLGYGDRGAGDIIPPGATLIFDVRLVLLNDEEWQGPGSEKRVLSSETLFAPKDCSKLADIGDDMSIHYHATREDKSTFGSRVDGDKPYGPFVLGTKGTLIPALDRAIPGMCLGERRRVAVPPRMGWYGTQHDTIMVEVDLLWMNGYQAEEDERRGVPAPQGPPRDEL